MAIGLYTNRTKENPSWVEVRIEEIIKLIPYKGPTKTSIAETLLENYLALNDNHEALSLISSVEPTQPPETPETSN